MSIPTYDKLLRPILVLTSEGGTTRRSATPEMVKQFGLDENEASERIPSGGSTYIANRTGWAMTFLTKAGLIEKHEKYTYRATQYGIEFLRSHPELITVADLKEIEGWEDAWNKGRKRKSSTSREANELQSESTPLETIAQEFYALRSELRDQLLQAVLDQTPEFFEKLVLDVLVSMGYGGSQEQAAEHVGRSGDEGIDGRINEDALGLDQILVQAKRYRPDRKIDRHAVQAFIGSLAGQGVSKGVFITTSSFVDSADEYVSRGSATKVVLVDGEMLIDLMLRHRIGVRSAQMFEIQELDQNYFDDDE